MSGEVRYISKKEKANYLFGLTGQNMVYSLIGASFFSYFMTDIALFPPIIVSALMIMMKVWDGVNDPIVGSFIDRHTFKNGEKMRPFLRYTPLPVGIFTVLLFFVFSTKESLLWLRVAYFVIMYICWDLAYTVQDVSMWGITAMVSPNSEERDRFVQWARTIGSISYGAFSTVIPMVLEMIANAKGVSMAFVTLVFAIIFGLGGAMMSFRSAKAQERIHVNLNDRQESLWESFSLLFKNKMMLLVTLANLCGALGFDDVRCVHARAEEPGALREQFDFALARAVARLNVLAELCLPFVKVGGAFLALKGPAAAEELEEARRAVSVLGGKTEQVFDYAVPGEALRHNVVVIRKVSATPKQYPRRFAIIKKSPL